MNRRHLIFVVLIAACATFASSAVIAESGDQLPADVTARVEAAVVYIHAEWKAADGSIEDSWGSGFFVSDTEIVTNHHVIAQATRRPGTRITIRTCSGRSHTKRYEAYVEREFENADLALLTVRRKPENVEPLSISAVLPEKDARVMGFGFPMGDLFDPSPRGPGVALRRGYVSRLTHGGAIIEADMNIDHGMSGGPAVDKNGLVVGVIQAMGGSSDNPTAFAFLISATPLTRFLQEAGSSVSAVYPPAEDGGADRMPETAPTPGEKSLRRFFSLGSALRIGTLITKILDDAEGDPDSDRLQTARMNAANVVRYLKDLSAPEKLIKLAEGTHGLLEEEPAKVTEGCERAEKLEKACDEWILEGGAEGLEKVNYDFGAWLIEMRVGLIDPSRDKETCVGFRRIAELQKAPRTTTDLLQQINDALIALEQERSVSGKDTIAKAAENLIAIGVLAPSNEGLRTPAAKGGGDEQEDRPALNRVTLPSF
ncbi:MAG: serine protease [Armatimonadota bacterium]